MGQAFTTKIVKELHHLIWQLVWARASVRPNTEYSAEYSAKNGRIFGTEYSANFADTPITENGAKMTIFDHFWS